MSTTEQIVDQAYNEGFEDGVKSAKAYPDSLEDGLKQVLGLQIFDTGPAARVLRDAGVCPDLPTQVEAEHAYILDMCIRLYLEHGAEWRNQFAEFVKPHFEAAKKIAEIRKTANQQN